MPAAAPWTDQKARLVDAGLLHPIFTKLDKISFTATSTTDFDPLLLPLHAQRLSELMDRCMTIRKDIRELEVWAVKAEADYQLFKITSVIDEQNETLRLQIDSKTSDQGGFENAIKVFSGKATLEEGLSAIAKGRSDALGKDVAASNNLMQNIANRWTAVRSYQEDYHTKYQTPGNAHNFGERAGLLLNVFAVLIDEAFARAAALIQGVYIIYGYQDKEMPTSVMLKDVDTFAMWAFRIIRSLARVAEQETDTEIVYPLVQPWLPDETPLITAKAFNDAIATAPGGKPIILPAFNFPDNGLLASNARLKGIGVSFGADYNGVEAGLDHNQTADSFKRIMVKITPPTQTQDSFARTPILVGNVGLLDSSQMATVEGNAVQNLSPFGEWTIGLHPFIIFKDQSKRDLLDNNGVSSPIRDLKVTLRFYVPGNFVMIPAPPPPTPDQA